MIDLAAARDLKLTLAEGSEGTLRALAAAQALIGSIEDEYGVLTATNPAEPPYIPSPTLTLGYFDPHCQRQPVTLDVAIKHAQAKAINSEGDPAGVEHQQLAEWLQELKDRRGLNEPGMADDELIRLGVAGGHTEHCAKRLVWGDGACECGLLPLAEAPPPKPQTVTEWQVAIYQYALAKGWYDNDTRTFGDNCALFTSEISEAYDEYRNGHEVTETYFNPDKPEKAEGVPTELADCVIRILDFCQRVGIDLQAIMEQKHAYNLTRAYRHGNKRT